MRVGSRAPAVWTHNRDLCHGNAPFRMVPIYPTHGGPVSFLCARRPSFTTRAADRWNRHSVGQRLTPPYAACLYLSSTDTSMILAEAGECGMGGQRQSTARPPHPTLSHRGRGSLFPLTLTLSPGRGEKFNDAARGDEPEPPGATNP